MNSKTTFLLFLCTMFSGTVFSQTTIKENDYTLTYNPHNIEITFNKSVSLQAFNTKSLTEKTIKVDSTKQYSYIISDPKPSEFIKLQYSENGSAANAFKTATIAAQSASTGVINVYFNHPVSTSLAQYQPAQNLGSNLDDKLITYINACQSTLDIAIYNSYSPDSSSGIAGAINAAFNRGVKVRVVYDGSTGSQMIPLLNPGIPTIASPNTPSYGIMHNKFVVFDADSSDPNVPWVWTGSTNWTVAQIDGPDKNNAIAVQDQALAQAYKMEFEEMWGTSTSTPDYLNSRFGPYKTDNTPHTFVIGGRAVGNYFSPSDGATQQIVNVINSADSDIEMASMLLTRDDIRDAILNKYSSGLQNIEGVFDSQNPQGNDVPTLKSNIGTTKIVSYGGAGIMHHKFLVVDNFNAASDPTVITGSHNWSSSAETKNDENILVVHDKIIADQYYQAFAYIYGIAGGALAVDETNNLGKKLMIYPNPTDGDVFFKVDSTLNGTAGSVAVYNVVGSKITELNFRDINYFNLNMSNYPKGLYFLKISIGDYIYQSKVLRK